MTRCQGPARGVSRGTTPTHQAGGCRRLDCCSTWNEYQKPSVRRRGLSGSARARAAVGVPGSASSVAPARGRIWCGRPRRRGCSTWNRLADACLTGNRLGTRCSTWNRPADGCSTWNRPVDALLHLGTAREDVRFHVHQRIHRPHLGLDRPGSGLATLRPGRPRVAGAFDGSGRRRRPGAVTVSRGTGPMARR